jgi:hypothetical protein
MQLDKLFCKAHDQKKIFIRSCFEVLDGIVSLSCLGLVFSAMTLQYLRYSICNKSVRDLLNYIIKHGFMSSFDGNLLSNIKFNLINGVLYLTGGIITICTLGTIENRFVEQMSRYRIKNRINQA